MNHPEYPLQHEQRAEIRLGLICRDRTANDLSPPQRKRERVKTKENSNAPTQPTNLYEH